MQFFLGKIYILRKVIVILAHYGFKRSYVEKEKRAHYIENIADEDELNDLRKKTEVPISEKSEQLKKEVNTRKPGEDVDPRQSLTNE